MSCVRYADTTAESVTITRVTGRVRYKPCERAKCASKKALIYEYTDVAMYSVIGVLEGRLNPVVRGLSSLKVHKMDEQRDGQTDLCSVNAKVTNNTAF